MGIRFPGIVLLPFGLLFLASLPTGGARAGLLDPPPQETSRLCSTAVETVEARHPLPPGLLFAIAQVESGRPVDGGAHRLPWPWTVQAQNQSFYFQSKQAAIRWVRHAETEGITSIDVGCMQVNLMYHPSAFRNLDDAFDPAQNAEYAAQFLLSLHAATGDWRQAAGRYHSETLPLAIPYRRRVEAILQGRNGEAALSPGLSRLQELQTAWDATLDQGGRKLSTPQLTGNWAGLQPSLARPQKIPVHNEHRRIMLSDAH